MNGWLVLADGTRFEGEGVGAPGLVSGEAVFNTSMAGYQEVFTDPQIALSRSSANAVYIATPVAFHASLTVKVLESGRHVLVEKPLGIDSRDARQAVDAAARNESSAGCSWVSAISASASCRRQMSCLRIWRSRLAPNPGPVPGRRSSTEKQGRDE